MIILLKWLKHNTPALLQSFCDLSLYRRQFLFFSLSLRNRNSGYLLLLSCKPLYLRELQVFAPLSGKGHVAERDQHSDDNFPFVEEEREASYHFLRRSALKDPNSSDLQEFRDTFTTTDLGPIKVGGMDDPKAKHSPRKRDASYRPLFTIT